MHRAPDNERRIYSINCGKYWNGFSKGGTMKKFLIAGMFPLLPYVICWALYAHGASVPGVVSFGVSAGFLAGLLASIYLRK